MKYYLGIKGKIFRFVDYVKSCIDKDVWLIYQMGKVGSTSIESALDKSLHFHTLYSNYQFKYAVMGFCSSGILKYMRQLIGRLLIHGRQEVNVITIIRDPSRRDISMFFQDLPYYLCRYNMLFGVDTRQEDSEYLREVFLKIFDFEYQEYWFDREIKRFTGIDIFSDRYILEDNVRIYKRGKYCVYLVRDIDVDDLIRLVCDEVGFERKNSGYKKWYGKIYKDVFDDFYSLAKNLSSLKIRRLYESW